MQDAYSLRCAPAGRTARRGTPLAHAATVAGRELASAIDNPVVLAGRAGGVQRQLPRRAASAYVLDFLAIAVADVASIARAAHRPAARRRPLARAAAVPGRRPGRGLRAT